jgi:hypothetical protein
LSSSAWGQDYPKVEVFGGFSLGAIEVQHPVRGTFDHEETIGFQAAVTVNVNRTLGFVTDSGGLWGDFPTSLFFSLLGVGSVEAGTFRMLHIFAGPRLTKRMDDFTVFVHALPGFARQLRTDRFNTTSTSNGFAVALGGGVDVNLVKHLAIRAVQVDYLPTSLKGGWENSLRLGFGVVWQFGGL